MNIRWTVQKWEKLQKQQQIILKTSESRLNRAEWTSSGNRRIEIDQNYKLEIVRTLKLN